MNLKSIPIPNAAKKLAAPLALLTVFLVGWYVGLPAKQAAAAGGDDAVWTCSMHPQVRQPNPGLCPICAMDLIELAPGGDGGLRELKVTAEAAALMDLRVSPVLRQPASVKVSLFGKLAYDERNVTTSTARIGGRLDRFYVDYTGTEVRKGDHIAEIYSPDLFVAQQDLIKAKRGVEAARRSGTTAAVQTQQRLLKSARERLRLLQLTDEQIDAIAAREKPSDQITLFSPQDGVVTERHVVEGAYVKTGDPLFAVAGLQSVWLNMEAYESDLPWLHYAQDVAFTVEALPGETFHGRIAYLDPELDDVRRVVRVRVNVENSKRLLKPGMFARAIVDAEVAGDGSVIDPGLAGKWVSPMHPEIIRDEPGKCPICGMPLVTSESLGFIAKAGGEHENALLVPASAVLRTGDRAVVYVRLKSSPEPVFEGREIVLGAKVGDQFIVDSGLAAGEVVVSRGVFKLDSELQLKARPSMMNRGAGLVETPAADAEASLLGQWSPVLRALGRLRDAAADGDEHKADMAMDTIASAVDSVSTASFHPVTMSAWGEFSMRLKNAIVIAKRKRGAELPIAFRDVRHAVEEAGRYLGLPSQTPASQSAATEEEIAELKSKLDAYLTLSTALAADDEAAARAAVPALAQQLGDGAQALADAEDIAAIRKAFDKVSQDLIAQVRAKGADRVGSVYVVHCPMVDDYEGADWISAKAEVINPYFGAEMLSCGTLTENLSFDAKSAMSQPGKTDPHAGHYPNETDP